MEQAIRFEELRWLQELNFSMKKAVPEFIVDVKNRFARHQALALCAVAARGSSMRKTVVAALGRTSRVPPCRCTRSRAVVRPRPVPTPGGLVVKNGSKIRS